MHVKIKKKGGFTTVIENILKQIQSDFSRVTTSNQGLEKSWGGGSGGSG